MSVGALLLLNLALLGFMFSRKQHTPPPRPAGHMERQKAIDKLNFDTEQLKLFNKSRDKHREAIKELNPRLRSTSLDYYMFQGSPDKLDSLFAKADNINDEIYKINKLHLEEVRSICNREQLENFDPFVASLLQSRSKRDDQKGRKRRK